MRTGTYRAPKVHVAPTSRGWLADAVRAGGAEVVAPGEASALVWAAPADPSGLAEILRANRSIEWVQLPWAGIEPYRDVIDDERRWTCAKGVYAEPVAEMALTLLLGGLRGVNHFARVDQWSGERGTSLFDRSVTVVGGGGIAEALLRLLAPWRARVTVVRRHPGPMKGAHAVVATEDLIGALSDADGVVLALALVPETLGIIGETALAAMQSHTWLVNVARGGHVDTDALVVALRDGVIGGAGLDVTEPEPLPAGHPLWTMENCVITPHVGNTSVMAKPLLAARVTENVRRYGAGEPLLGPVDASLGY
ncbi:MAG: hydroxyacid dehydrogenase [Actinomycetota bacterium]|nr:hydroxyacid dehydrogenase [Actinomycetota bacterium]